MPPLPNKVSQSTAAPSSSFTSAGEILPTLGITKRRFKQVESICLIREQRASGRQELAFNARHLSYAGFHYAGRRKINSRTHGTAGSFSSKSSAILTTAFRSCKTGSFPFGLPRSPCNRRAERSGLTRPPRCCLSSGYGSTASTIAESWKDSNASSRPPSSSPPKIIPWAEGSLTGIASTFLIA
jgi:hypothetical protein